MFLPLAVVILLSDQLSKALVRACMVSGTSTAVLPNIFHLTLVENRGIAFGLFQGFDPVLFSVITVSIFLLMIWGFRTPPAQVRIQGGIGLVLGGALGNWIDRVRLGAVVDFLDFRIWPVFNLADTAITIGVGLFLLDLLRKRRAA